MCLTRGRKRFPPPTGKEATSAPDIPKAQLSPFDDLLTFPFYELRRMHPMSKKNLFTLFTILTILSFLASPVMAAPLPQEKPPEASEVKPAEVPAEAPSAPDGAGV